MHKVPIAIVSALDDEVRPIKSRMSVDSRVHLRPGLLTRGTYRNRPIILVRSGVGRPAMRNIMDELIRSHDVDLVLHTGYCGGADPSLAPGDLVVANAIVDARSGKRIDCDAELVMRAKKILQHRSMRGTSGGLVTVDKVAESPHDKAFLATQHASMGIDMESSELADACSESDVPFVVVRAVLDPLDYEVPNLGDAIDEDGSTDGLKLAEHLVRKPADFLKLPKLGYLASQARNAIAEFVDAWLDGEDEQ